MTIQPLLDAINADRAERPYLYQHDYLNARQIPCELAAAQTAAVAAWKLYDEVIDRLHTAAEWQDALAAANAADNAVKDWNSRWQRVGGTSNIRSIMDAETPPLYVPGLRVAKFMDAA